MLVTESRFDPLLIHGPADELHSRSGGLHLSRIYRDIEETLGTVRSGQFTEEELNFYRAGGFIWEWVVQQAFARACIDDDYVRPGEFQLDGITGSPDLIQLSTWTIIDTKATWVSARKLDFLEKYRWSWLVQLKGYAKMVGTSRTRLIVLCVNGNYAPPQPCIRQFDLEFKQQEIDDNWSMILGHAKRRGWL